MKYFLNLFLLIFVSISIHSQKSEVKNEENFIEFKGKVINAENEEPLPFANISVVGSNITSITNNNGEFVVKIPDSNLLSKVKISFIGYKTEIIDLETLEDKNKIISLDVFIVPLPEAIITIPKNVDDLVRETLSNANNNYLTEHNIMTAFYRESIKRKKRNISLSEAVVDIYKSPYKRYQKKEVIDLLKIRKDTDYSRLDTVAFKIAGGPYNTLRLDLIKYDVNFIPLFFMSNYDFWIHRTSEINGLPVYVVKFKQKAEIRDPLFFGELFIDGENKILLSANFSLNVEDKIKSSRLFVRKKPRNANVWPVKTNFRVDYTQKNGKWYYNYSNSSIDFKINWDRKIFNTTYSITSEMLVTDWKLNNESNYPDKNNIIKPSIILADSKKGFEDLDFWGRDNIIEPDNSIQNAIKKIQRKLKRLRN